jgi:hypothetical protein
MEENGRKLSASGAGRSAQAAELRQLLTELHDSDLALSAIKLELQ